MQPLLKTRLDLEQLKEKYLDSSWLRRNVPEPRIGDIDCPADAEEYGLRGQSCYTIFVTNRGSGDFGCIEEGCVTFSAKSRESALRHQRDYHFGHKPFVCTPSNGVAWFVVTSLIYTPRVLYPDGLISPVVNGSTPPTI
jgi:hypothetical protein